MQQKIPDTFLQQRGRAKILATSVGNASQRTGRGYLSWHVLAQLLCEDLGSTGLLAKRKPACQLEGLCAEN